MSATLMDVHVHVGKRGAITSACEAHTRAAIMAVRAFVKHGSPATCKLNVCVGDLNVDRKVSSEKLRPVVLAAAGTRVATGLSAATTFLLGLQTTAPAVVGASCALTVIEGERVRAAMLGHAASCSYENVTLASILD